MLDDMLIHSWYFLINKLIQEVKMTRGLNRRQLKEMLGDPSDATLWRIMNEDPDFPQPIQFMNGRHRIWAEDDMTAYLEKRRNAPLVKREVAPGAKRGRKRKGVSSNA